MISNARLWLNADKSAVVEDGSPDAAFLLCGVGGQISDEHARMAKDQHEPTEPVAHEIKPAPTKPATPKKTTARK
jgi:hypothetical protein